MARRRKVVCYENRVVCFVDLLGFSATVMGTQKPTQMREETIRRIASALDSIADSANNEDRKSSIRITQFSDSLVISFLTTEPSGVFHVLISILHLVMNMINHGFLCRGGIAIGPLVHTKRMIFGPAFIEAYNLERCNAKNPRVIASKKLITIAKAHGFHEPDEEGSYVRSCLRRDADGRFYVDYLAEAEHELEDVPSYILYLKRVRRILEVGLRNDAENIRNKYQWLRTKYNTAIYTARRNAKCHQDPEIRSYAAELLPIKSP